MSLQPGGQCDEVYQQIGQITRQLHDTLEQLGLMPGLQRAADGLPDARSRLGYIAEKSGAAAEKVLNCVDLAKLEQRRMAEAAHAIAAAAGPALAPLAENLNASAARLDAHLTDIMLAQDFHDLTGQVVAKVVALASELEDSLVKLLVQAAPSELPVAPAADLGGPVVDPGSRTDVVSSQGEVDELLASLGF
jgi:chemotaxis protein CheZ